MWHLIIKNFCTNSEKGRNVLSEIFLLKSAKKNIYRYSVSQTPYGILKILGTNRYIDGNSMGVNKEYADLYKELEILEENGIYMTLEGVPASAFQVVKAHMVKESGAYMRDYILDSDGHLQVLIFNDIQQDIPHV